MVSRVRATASYGRLLESHLDPWIPELHGPLSQEESPEQRKVAYDSLAENPSQIESAETVDFTAARGGYKPRKVAYDRLAENLSQVESVEEVDFTAARGGYKRE
jgi:hypothetical protein